MHHNCSGRSTAVCGPVVRVHSLVMKEGSECEKGLAGSVSEFELNVDKVAKQLKSHLKVCWGMCILLVCVCVRARACVCVCVCVRVCV